MKTFPKVALALAVLAILALGIAPTINAETKPAIVASSTLNLQAPTSLAACNNPATPAAAFQYSQARPTVVLVPAGLRVVGYTNSTASAQIVPGGILVVSYITETKTSPAVRGTIFDSPRAPTPEQLAVRGSIFGSPDPKVNTGERALLIGDSPANITTRTGGGK